MDRCGAVARPPTSTDTGPSPSVAVVDASPTMRAMYAVVWHYWIGVALALGALATMASLVGNYLRKVESTRYPKGR
jgi:hypothetical protein